VEEVPWGDGKRTLTRAYIVISGLLGAPTVVEGNGRGFRTSWEKVFDGVEHVVPEGA
jgi:transposase